MTAPAPDLFSGRGAVQVAALYVATDGCYFGMPDVDPWDQLRDARAYAGPHPVVAHPPCERWGRYWFGSPTVAARTGFKKKKGDDGGCFSAALDAVRKFGGVLEHPAGSHAWAHFGLLAPPHDGGWVAADWCGGWTCQVEQGHYGHRARKATWLYAVRVQLPLLKWGASIATAPQEIGVEADRKRQRSAGDAVELMTHEERAATPAEFRDLLLSMARSARRSDNRHSVDGGK